jgi:hypothetical protein
MISLPKKQGLAYTLIEQRDERMGREIEEEEEDEEEEEAPAAEE